MQKQKNLKIQADFRSYLKVYFFSLDADYFCLLQANKHCPKTILFTQTPLRTAFHDTQRLLLEVYISNVRSVFVFFAPLMKK